MIPVILHVMFTNKSHIILCKVTCLLSYISKPRTRAPIWHPDVCKIARHRSKRLRMSILRKEGEGGGITRGN